MEIIIENFDLLLPKSGQLFVFHPFSLLSIKFPILLYWYISSHFLGLYFEGFLIGLVRSLFFRGVSITLALELVFRLRKVLVSTLRAKIVLTFGAVKEIRVFVKILSFAFITHDDS